MDWIQAILLLLLGIVVWLFNKKPPSFPPGPRGLPLVGYLPFVGKRPHEKFVELSKKYGKVIGLQLGVYKVVVLNDFESIKEALVNQSDVFSGRPENIIFEEMTQYDDIALANGTEWRERRRFALHHLRDFGFGRRAMEDVIQEEIQKLSEYVKTFDNKSMEIQHFFIYSLHNVIWSVVGGKRFEQEDQLLKDLCALADILIRHLSSTNAVIFMPYLKPFFRNSLLELRQAIGNLNKHLVSQVTEQVDTYQDGHHRHFIDAFVNEIHIRQGSNEHPEYFKIKNLVEVTKSLFMGGVDTVSTILSWAMLYMITWPSIQMKVQDELDRVIGRQRLPTYRDRLMLPYTEAVVSEIYRFSSIAPLSTIRVTTRTTRLFDYTIPKGTLVFPNLWAVHYDPNLWEDPHIFRPERFLNDKGEIQRPKHLIPFALGGRSCLGESLARTSIFMMVTGLLHQFTFSTIAGTPPPTFDPEVTVMLAPKPFAFHVQQRR